jgi:transposase InsO family protein
LNPLIKINVVIDNKMKIKAVYDSGSNATLINQRVIDLLKSSLIRHKSALKLMNGFSFCSARADIILKIGNRSDTLNAYVVKNNNFSYDLLLGLDAIRKFKLLQDDNLNILQRLSNNRVMKLHDIEEVEKYVEVNFNEYIDISQIHTELDHIEDKWRKLQIAKLIEKYKHMFAKDKFDVGRVKSKQAEIKLIKDAEYVNCRAYKCSIPDEQEIKTQIKKLLEADLIEESESPFASPVTLAYKKDDGKRSRLCIDFRRLNKLIVPECYPFPTINDVIDKVSNCRFFTVIDINSAFWCILLKIEDREKTSFTSKFGKFMFKVLPFGLKNAPAIFQRILSNIIRRNNLDEFSINYIDDILIFSKTWDEHVQHIEKFFNVIEEEGFKLKLVKCKFAATSVKYLGHVIRENQVSPAQENLVAIKKLKQPTDKSGVRSILGTINFYLKYIPNSAQKFEPLHRLLRKDTKFEWSKECDDCFVLIKEYLCSTPILAIYDINKDIFIETDASYKGLGATLKQPQTDGKLHPVGYFSRKLSEREKKLDIIHLECKAIKEAIKYWQFYLIGREFTVYSDHKPLENLRTKSRTDEILGDLVHYLSQFNFKIIYKKGKENVMADMLSRHPVLEYFENQDAFQVVNLVELSEILNDQKTNIIELKNAKKTHRKHNITFKKLKDKPRVFTSVELGKKIIKRVHDKYGHIGTAQICATIRPYYYFKNMDKTVNEFCKSCSICIENKVRKGRVIGLMEKLGPPKEPYEIMSLDTVGGFSGNRSTKRYMHILVDHFSRYAWISTSKGQCAKDFIKLIQPIASKQEIGIILADQYTAINSDEFSSYLSEMNIKLLFTSIDCPQSNGMNERLNQTLVNRIRCKINSNDKRAWSVIADECVFEYNRTIHSSTKFEPAYLLYEEKSEICPIDFLNTRNLVEDRKTAFENSMKGFKINKERVDRNRKKHEFKIGDLVYVENGSKMNRRKTDKVRIGPFRILQKISTLIYEVDTGKKKKNSNYFHVCKLSPAGEATAEGEV